MIIFNKLWDTMKSRGISTYMLREKYSIDSKTIRRLKSNKNMETDTLDMFCKILNCELSDVAEYRPDEYSKKTPADDRRG